MNYTTLASQDVIDKTKTALERNGLTVQIARNGREAKEQALALIPEGAEVFAMTSITTEAIGLTQTINESGKYDAVRPKLMQLMNDPSKSRERKKLGAAPAFATGSVHAVTEDGRLLIASNTGSQLGAYAYGADRVIWIVGAQKIVPDIDQGLKRIYDYVLPLEAERARKAYGAPGSNVSKLLIFNKEVTPGRVTIILVNEVLGF